MSWSRIGSALLVLGLALVQAGVAGATGSGYDDFRPAGPQGGPGGGRPIDDVYVSGDGTLEFYDFRFIGIRPEDVTIDVGDSGIAFSGPASRTYFGPQWFSISYSVRALDGLQIVGTELVLDSEVPGPTGAVIATKRIRAPRAPEPKPPWTGPPSFDGDRHGGRHHGDEGYDGGWERDGESGGDGWDRPGYGWEGERHGWGRAELIGSLVAFNIANGWICGCGHYHDSAGEVEPECRIEQDSDAISYDPETRLRITDTLQLLSFGKDGVTWHSLENRYLVTPEPGTAGLLALGLFGLILSEGRRR